MLRETHYLRRNKSVGLPKRLIFLDTETEGKYEMEFDAEVHRFQMGWTWFVYGQGGVYAMEKSDWVFHDDAGSMLRYIESKAVKSTPLFVFGSNVLFDIGASGLIPWFTDREWERDFYYSQGLSFMLVIHKGERRIKFLSMQNFLPGSIEEVGKMIGLPKIEVDFDEVGGADLSLHCLRDTEILGRGIFEYLEFVRRFDLGQFRLSVSGQAMAAYRHRFMDQKILIYHEPVVNEFERSGYFGGRVEAFQIGGCKGGPFIQLDVNGMYPFVMKMHVYPRQLYQCRENVSTCVMGELLDHYSVIARCRIRTDEPVYPVKIDGLTCFPVGEFITTLCTGSLEYALHHGHLISVERATLYHRADLFSEYVDFFWRLRRNFQMEENAVMEYVSKLFMNSLYGKFGEQRDSLVDYGWVDENDAWRQEYYNEVTEKWGIEEVLFHRWVLYEGKEEGPQSMPAIAAHVTDYARMYLWKLMKLAGKEGVLYADTDSFILPRSAYRYGEQLLYLGSDLGQLKVEAELEGLVIHGCKDYEAEGKVVRKGIRRDAKYLGSGVFFQEQFPTILGLMRLGCWTGLPVKRVKKQLYRQYKKGIVQADGRVTPYVLHE